MARPKKDINWDIVEKKIEAGCSAKEIYTGVCDSDTFYNRFKDYFGKSFSDYSDDYYSVGNGNIKFTQYMKALAGNVPMLMLLGRERLSQGKEQERHSPYDDMLALRHENMILKAALANYKEHENADQSETR